MFRHPRLAAASLLIRRLVRSPEYGNYFVLNLAGRYFVDDAHRHRIGVNLQNVFDEEYATRLSGITGAGLLSPNAQRAALRHMAKVRICRQ